MSNPYDSPNEHPHKIVTSGPSRGVLYAAVLVFGYGLCVFGFLIAAIGTGKTIFGLIMLSPFCFIIWVPCIGLFLSFSLWALVANCLVNAVRPFKRYSFVALLLSHYVGVAIIVALDLEKPPIASELFAAWRWSPLVVTMYVVMYLVGHVLLWDLFFRQTELAWRKRPGKFTR